MSVANTSVMTCLVIMPFEKEFKPVYRNIKRAVESTVAPEPMTCVKLDERTAAGRISDRLVQELSSFFLRQVTRNDESSVDAHGTRCFSLKLISSASCGQAKARE